MSGRAAGEAFLWCVFLYVATNALCYLVLAASSWRAIQKQRVWKLAQDDAPAPSGPEPPISLIIPAYNEERTIVSTVRSAMQLAYCEFEVLVVNDGSRDRTLQALIEEFGLVPFPLAGRVEIPTERVRGAWRSPRHPGLRVIDKDNGGKADALNAGVNAARYALICAVDADSILTRESLLRVVQPFVHQPETVACGAAVRLANGCSVDSGMLERVALPTKALPRFQLIEYLRAFLFGRMGWSLPNGLLIISGAFGIMRRSVVVECGGYLRHTIGEDMELVLRMHRLLKAQGRDYRIAFVPDPAVWTEAPEDLRTLRNQRARWQRGLSESLWNNRALLWSRRGGVAGWLAFPYFVLFEWLSPVVELAGYGVTVVLIALGLVNWPLAAWFLAASLSFGLLLSAVALLLEEEGYRLHRNRGDLRRLLAAALLENFGYRQLNACFRLQGMVQWATGRRASWGAMRRSGAWQSPEA